MSVTDAPVTHVPATASEEFELRSHSPAERVQHLLHTRSWLSPAVILVLSCLVFGVIAPGFFTAGNLSLIIQQVAVTAALATGQAIIIMTAGVDLSIGAIMVCTSLLVARLVTSGVPGGLALLTGLGFGALSGSLNGAIVTRLRMPPFIVTLGTLSFFTAISLLITNCRTLDGADFGSLVNWTGKTFALGQFTISFGVVLVAIVFAVVFILLNQTAWGTHVYAVGDDAEASRLAGIVVQRVLFSAYVIAGAVYAITGWVLIGRIRGASPNTGIDANLDSITAVVIGGVSLFGGRGSLIGALIVGVFQNGLFLYGVAPLFQQMALGILVVVAVGLDQWIKRVRT